MRLRPEALTASRALTASLNTYGDDDFSVVSNSVSGPGVTDCGRDAVAVKAEMTERTSNRCFSMVD